MTLTHLNSYQFSDPYYMKVNAINYNLSGIQVDLSEILAGGIGRGAFAPQLLASGMHMLGHGNGVYNLPFCVERRYSPFAFHNHENNYCDTMDVKNSVSKALDNQFSLINLPLDVDGHASLASIVFKDRKVCIKFYDSLSSDVVNYSERYSIELIEFIQKILPENYELEQNHEVVHLLDQGDKNSSGCGYYTIYTAALLVEREDVRQFSGKLLLTSSHDKKIRAELAVRSLLWYGLKQAEKELDQVRYFGIMRHVFHKLQCPALDKLIQSIYQKNVEIIQM